MSKQTMIIIGAVLVVGAVAAGVWFMGSAGDDSSVNVTAPRSSARPAPSSSAEQGDQGPLARSAPRQAPTNARRLDAPTDAEAEEATAGKQAPKQQRKQRKRAERRRRPKRQEKTEEVEPLVPMEPVGKEKTRKVRGK